MLPNIFMFPQTAVGYAIYRNVRVYRIASVYRTTRVYRIARVYRIDRANQRIERRAHSLTDLTPSAPAVHSLKSNRLHTTQERFQTRDTRWRCYGSAASLRACRCQPIRNEGNKGFETRSRKGREKRGNKTLKNFGIE